MGQKFKEFLLIGIVSFFDPQPPTKLTSAIPTKKAALKQPWKTQSKPNDDVITTAPKINNN